MEELLNYMYNLERFGIKLGLETMNSILNLFDNPQNKFKTIHIAGTNGKGSTASFIFNILKQQYSNVGLYTSPHLHQFNERIKINDNFISDEEIVELIKEVKQKSEENNIHLTFFEFTTTIMFLHFARKKVDIAVIEVGMGGRLDATNIITPLISIITNIGLDHTHILGDTKLKIAAEKAGIIKQNIPLITAEKSEEILEFFFEICKQKNSEILEVENYKILSSNLDGQRFIYLGEDYFIKMLG
ncbi:MAG: folylpolyglutamate synthase/dihydrofolate synthase family protein, partial [Candidatus Woesearchaeota archaeon]